MLMPLLPEVIASDISIAKLRMASRRESWKLHWGAP
jgi:hypothetical protein